MRGFDFLAVDENVAELNQALNGAARHRRVTRSEVGVEPFIGQGLLDGEPLGAARLGGDATPYLLAHQLFWMAGRDSFTHDARKSRPTPVQIAVSATLNAGKPASSPFRVIT